MNGKRNNSYLDEFIEAQKQQYTPWKYLAENRPTPYYEAKGNPKLMGIWYSLGAVFMGVGAFTVYRWGHSIPGFIIVLAVAVLLGCLGLGYFRIHKIKKAYAKKQAAIVKSRRRKKKH